MAILHALTNRLTGRTQLFNSLFYNPCKMQVRILMMENSHKDGSASFETTVQKIIEKCIWSGAAFCQDLFTSEMANKILNLGGELRTMHTAQAALLLHSSQMCILKASLSGDKNVGDVLGFKLCSTLSPDLGMKIYKLIGEMNYLPPLVLHKAYLLDIYPRLRGNTPVSVYLELKLLSLASQLREFFDNASASFEE